MDFSLSRIMILLLFSIQLAFLLFIKHHAVQSLPTVHERQRAGKNWNRGFLLFALFLMGISRITPKICGGGKIRHKYLRV